jgi:surface carbohydrate biosynthesis protein
MPQEPVDILLFVEHVARELDTACAVKHLVTTRHKLNIQLASMTWDLGATLNRYLPKVVALPYCYSISDLGTHRIIAAWPDAHYVNLAYEQLFAKINKAHKVPRDVFARNWVLHHAWGDFYGGFLVENGTDPRNIAVNGNPSYELYRPPYRDYFESRQDLGKRFGLDPRKRWVFVPENYGVAFMTERQILVRYGDSRMGDALEFRDFAANSFRQAARWWRDACEKNGIELILRPRPATPKNMMVEALERDGPLPPNLHVTKDGTVREWILAGDVVVSSYSTTLIEASVACKPILMMAPIPFPEYLLADWNNLVPKVQTEDAFLDAVAARTDLSETYKPLQAWAHQSMLSRGDAIRGMADLLASVRKGERFAPGPPGVDILKTKPREPLPKKLRGLLRRTINAVRRTPGKTWEGDRISPADVSTRISRWATILG